MIQIKFYAVTALELCAMLQRELIQTLQEHTRIMQAQARQHKSLAMEILTQRPAPDKWNALECYEHMNRYGTKYIGFSEEALLKAKPVQGAPDHKPGLIGGYSIKSMEPQEVGVKKPMKTFSFMNPKGEELEVLVIDRFLKQQEVMQDILKRAEKVDIDRVKSRTTIKLLHFKLSDALHFYTTHNRRHMVQVERALEVK